MMLIVIFLLIGAVVLASAATHMFCKVKYMRPVRKPVRRNKKQTKKTVSVIDNESENKVVTLSGTLEEDRDYNQASPDLNQDGRSSSFRNSLRSFENEARQRLNYMNDFYWDNDSEDEWIDTATQRRLSHWERARQEVLEDENSVFPTGTRIYDRARRFQYFPGQETERYVRIVRTTNRG